MVITRSASNNTTDTNIEGDVAEALNKGTMKRKRKTTAEEKAVYVKMYKEKEAEKMRRYKKFMEELTKSDRSP
ncbi:ATP-dependent rRNA helicase spb4 [Bienertia sinuspersici]